MNSFWVVVAKDEQPWEKKAREFADKERAKAQAKAKDADMRLANQLVTKVTPVLQSWVSLAARAEMDLIGQALKQPVIDGTAEFQQVLDTANDVVQAGGAPI